MAPEKKIFVEEDGMKEKALFGLKVKTKNTKVGEQKGAFTGKVKQGPI